MERHINARERNSCDTALQSDIATLRSLEAVVDNILQHTLNLLDAEDFQELLWTQLISVTQYNVRGNLLYLLGVNFL